MAFVDEFGLIKTAETLESLRFLECNFAQKPTLSKSLTRIILRALSSCPNESSLKSSPRGRVLETGLNYTCIYVSCCRALRELFPDKRPFVLTRSTFSGTAHHAIHWLGDNQSQWRQIPWSIISMLEFSMFGFSMVSYDNS